MYPVLRRVIYNEVVFKIDVDKIYLYNHLCHDKIFCANGKIRSSIYWFIKFVFYK